MTDFDVNILDKKDKDHPDREYLLAIASLRQSTAREITALVGDDYATVQNRLNELIDVGLIRRVKKESDEYSFYTYRYTSL